jgi:hypothetical protein
MLPSAPLALLLRDSCPQHVLPIRTVFSSTAETTSSGLPLEAVVRVNGGQWNPFVVPRSGAATRGTLLEALVNSKLFGVKLRDVALDECKTLVLQSGATGKKPTAEEEASAVELEGAETLEQLVTNANITPTNGQLWIRVLLPTAVFPPLPMPIHFKKTSLRDATGECFHVADLSGGPFFLEDLNYQKLVAWALDHPALDQYRFLALTGPIKSGKPAILTRVLPGMLAAQHAVAGGPKLVFFHFAFLLNEGPEEAALSMADSAAALARRCGVTEIVIPTTGNVARAALPRIMEELASRISDAGGELIILLDEVQAPILAAPTPAAAALFASTLKQINSICRHNARIAITGSGMLSLLNTLRTVPPNGMHYGTQ